MSDLTNEDILVLGRAVSLDIDEPELTQVRYSLNAILEALDQIEVEGLARQEPLPIIPPQEVSDE